MLIQKGIFMGSNFWPGKIDPYIDNSWVQSKLWKAYAMYPRLIKTKPKYEKKYVFLGGSYWMMLCQFKPVSTFQLTDTTKV
jgi:hypothetical protein